MWVVVFASVGAISGAYAIDSSHFLESGWLGLPFFVVGASYFVDVARGRTVAIGWARVSRDAPFLVRALAFLVALFSSAFGIALMYRPLIESLVRTWQ